MADLKKGWEEATPLQGEWDSAAPVKAAAARGQDIVGGVPAWGRENPNLYAATQTGLDMLPMAAGLVGSPLAGLAAAGALNAGGKYIQRKIADQPTDGWDVAKDVGYGATTEGGGRALRGVVKGVTNIPAVQQGLNGVANRIIRSAGKFGTGGGLLPAEQKAIADTVLKKGYLFNPESHGALMDTVKANTGAVDDIYAAGTAAGDTFKAEDVMNRGDFAKLIQRGKDVKGVDPDYLGNVIGVMGTFKAGASPLEDYAMRGPMGETATVPKSTLERIMAGHLGPQTRTSTFGGKSAAMDPSGALLPEGPRNIFGTPKAPAAIDVPVSSRTVTVHDLPSKQELIDAQVLGYTPSALNVSKRQIYQDLGNAYKNGKVNDASEQGGKTLAHAIKETLDAKYPDAVPLNADSHELLTLEPYFARAINRISQRDAVGLGEKIALGSLKDPVSLSDLSPGKLGKLVAAVWDRPEIKSKVARMIYSQKPRAGSVVIKNAGKVVAPSLKTALEGEMYTAPSRWKDIGDE